MQPKKKTEPMTLLIQLNRQRHYLFIALLLACFAFAQSGRAVTPDLDASTGAASAGTAQQANENHPNKREIRFNVQRGLQCAGGNVTVRGKLVVGFKNVPDFGVVTAFVRLEEFSGTAASGDRKLRVIPKDVDFSRFVNVNTGIGEGKFGIELKINGPGLPGGAPLRLKLTLSPIVYKFQDGKVTRIIPDDMPILSCLH
jgi:hypothetical protein